MAFELSFEGLHGKLTLSNYVPVMGINESPHKERVGKVVIYDRALAVKDQRKASTHEKEEVVSEIGRWGEERAWPFANVLFFLVILIG